MSTGLIYIDQLPRLYHLQLLCNGRRYEFWNTSLEDMKTVTVLLFLFVIGFLAFIYANAHKTTEGFDGNVPYNTQTSSIADDTSAATTSNPQMALPQPKDVEALMEVIKNFKLLYNAQDPMTLNLTPQDLQQTQYFMMQSDNLINELQAALVNSDATRLSLDDVNQLRKAYDSSIDILRGKTALPEPTQVGSNPNALTIDTLINLKTRVSAESLRLSNLRSSSADIMTRISQLDKLTADLDDIISSVKRGVLNLNEVHITPTDADNFLKSLGTNKTAPVPQLNVPQGAKPTSTTIGPTAQNNPMNIQIQDLLQMARTMKWSMTIGVESDPAFAQTQQILDKVTAIEAVLNKYMISDTPIPPKLYTLYMNQLKVLQNLAGGTADVTEMRFGPPKPIVQLAGDTRSEAEFPSQRQLDIAQGENMGMGMAAGSAASGIGSGELTDDNIQHRASAASFDDSMAGGLDYKTRVMEMCRQIQAANLGDPTNFGCIKNPNEVSASYSWKGNYQMVCSRLGDTWGAWYPQMFGCPKVDATAKFLRTA